MNEENLASTDLEREISAGQKAKTVLESEAFQQAVDRVQGAIYSEFTDCDPEDTKKLQYLRIKQNALADVVRELKSAFDAGFLAVQQKVEQETRERAEEAAKAGDSARVLQIRGIG